MEFYKHLVKPTQFEGHYNAVREKEGRILSIEQIRQLPITPKNYDHHQEWNKRIRSTNRFLEYLQKKQVKTLLDVGCGNGWLMFKMASLLEHITGLDINHLELEQAAAVLAPYEHVTLKYGHIFDLEPAPEYDLILFNASVQYFPDLSQLIAVASRFLSDNGEIHILDSPIYPDSTEAEKAKQRTIIYYEQQGVPDMINFYHHHNFQDLDSLDYRILYNPTDKFQRLKRKFISDIPLYWLVINKPQEPA
ncbi:MAG: class I SAM-dependent methyltransferase [Roseivirga sp.]|nr:class I SAM-dependent methyltransferase [Roseivirga sp.]